MTAAFNVPIPFSHAPAVELGNGSRLWRKRLLSGGQVAYRGRMLNFDRVYLRDLAAALPAGVQHVLGTLDPKSRSSAPGRLREELGI